MKCNPFDVIKAINAGEKECDLEGYNPYIINRFYSFFPDTLWAAQEMNLNYDLNPKYQHLFYINTIRPRNRYSKWLKSDEIRGPGTDFETVQDYFGFSDMKTKEALAILTEEQLKIIRDKMGTF